MSPCLRETSENLFDFGQSQPVVGPGQFREYTDAFRTFPEEIFPGSETYMVCSLA